MECSIFYLIKGKADKCNKKLVSEVGPKFGERYLIENPLPSHITLKFPFKTNNIKKVEKKLKEFTKKQSPSKINIRGFGNFNGFVIFMKIKFSKQAFRTQKELLKELEKIGIMPCKFDIKYIPHATIAYGNTKNNFNNIWKYIKTLKKPEFNLKLDHITLMKKLGKRWIIHKEFKINK